MMMSFAATSVVGLVLPLLLVGILTTTTQSSLLASSILVTVEAFHTDRVTTSLLPSSQSLLLDRRGGGGGRRRSTQEIRPARSSSFVPSSSSSVAVLVSTTNRPGSDINTEDPEAAIFNILGEGRISLSVRRSTDKTSRYYLVGIRKITRHTSSGPIIPINSILVSQTKTKIVFSCVHLHRCMFIMFVTERRRT